MKKKITMLVAALSLTTVLAGCTSVPANTVFSIDDLVGKKIGVQLGTTGDIYASGYADENPADAEGNKTEVRQFSKGADGVIALKQGKIDCVLIDNEPAKVFVQKNKDLKILDDPFEEEEYAIAMKKGNTELKEKIDAALSQLQEDGTLQLIKDYYIGENAGKTQYVSPENVDRSNGTLRMATNAEFGPYEYMDGDKIVGLDVDMAQAVCDILGMELYVETIAWDSIIPAIDSGKYDVAVSGMSNTEERRQSVDFSITYTTATQVIIVRAK